MPFCKFYEGSPITHTATVAVYKEHFYSNRTQTDESGIHSIISNRVQIYIRNMDRTDWKFGEFNINILMLGITYKGIAFPLIFSLLPKRGNSNWEERKKIMERFIRLFGAECIDCLVADREFIGKEWTGWLNSRRIRYYIRIRQNFRIVKPSTGEYFIIMPAVVCPVTARISSGDIPLRKHKVVNVRRPQ